MRKYELRTIDAEGNTEPWYVAEGCIKRVSPDKPDYLAWLAEGNKPKKIKFVPPYVPTEQERLDAFTSIKKLTIREALAEMGLERELDKILEDPVFRKYWHDADVIDLNHDMVKLALQQFPVDVDTIKKHILGL